MISFSISGRTPASELKRIVAALNAFSEGAPIESELVRDSRYIRERLGVDKRSEDVVINQTFMSADEARQEAVEANPDSAVEALTEAVVSSAVPLPPAAPSTADASASPIAPAVSEVFAATPTSDASPSASTNPVPAAAATGLVLDAKGLPWDARIHAGSKTQNADGSWRQRRNLNDPALVSRVEAELRAAMNVGAQPSTAQPATTVDTGVSSASSIPTPPTTSGQLDFAGFMKWYVPLVTAQAITVEQTAEILKTIPLASITMLGVRPDLIPQVKAAIEAQL
jgi:hypothetical protein